MELPFALKNNVVEFLSSLPNFHNIEAQRALIYRAGLDRELQDQIPFGLPASQFIPVLVEELLKYETLKDGRNALKAVLEAAKSYVGHNKQEICETLLKKINNHLQQVSHQANISQSDDISETHLNNAETQKLIPQESDAKEYDEVPVNFEASKDTPLPSKLVSEHSHDNLQPYEAKNQSLQGLEKLLREAVPRSQEEQKVRAQLIELVVTQFSPKDSWFFWILLFISICLIFVGIAHTQHISSAQITLQVTTKNFKFILRDEWLMTHPLTSKIFFINNLDKIPSILPLTELPDSVHDVDPEDNSIDMKLEGNEGTLITTENLLFPKDAPIRLITDSPDRLEVKVKDSSISGNIAVKNADLTVYIKQHTEKRTLLDRGTGESVPVRIPFNTIKAAAAPISSKFIGINDWKLLELDVQAIDFRAEFAPNTGVFEPTIDSGSISFWEEALTRKLQTDEFLEIGMVENGKIDISKEHDCIPKDYGCMRISFTGTVGKLKTKPKEKESEDPAKNLMPTYLEYLGYQERILFAFTAVVILWGVFCIRYGISYYHKRKHHVY